MYIPTNKIHQKEFRTKYQQLQADCQIKYKYLKNQPTKHRRNMYLLHVYICCMLHSKYMSKQKKTLIKSS